ncbi:MAG: hypothetical protein ABI687_13705 [Flavitalea sp.]
MNITFYQIAGDEPGTSIYINPLQVVKVVPNGQNAKIHLSDKSIYDVAQTATAIKNRLQECMI